MGLGGSFLNGNPVNNLKGSALTGNPLCYARILTEMFGRQGFSLMSSAQQVTDATFDQEVVESPVPVLVDFWAPWCGPCRMVAPVVDEISKEYEGKVKVVKLNTDENPSVANKYGIRSIPTLMIFKGGQRVDMVVGAVPKTTLANTLDKYL
jgi:thioredoxin 1